MTDLSLDQRLIAAHERGDRMALVQLYTEAADEAPQKDAECFFLVHAYIFGLETNHPSTAILHARLVAEGREA